MRPRLTAAVLLAIACSATGGEIRFQTKRFSAVVGADAVWRELIETGSGQSLLARNTPIALVQVDGRTCAANSAAFAGDRLSVGFSGADTRLEYAIEQSSDWVTFRLSRITGTRPERVTLLQIAVTPTEHVGPRLNGAWNDRAAVVLMGTGRQTLGRPARREGWTDLAAVAQDAPGPRLEQSAAALIVAPLAQIRGVLADLAAAYKLPTNVAEDGTPSKDTAAARGSYWFLSFAEAEVDRVIEYCRKTGFQQVMLSSDAWCTSPGHYTFNTNRYPGGLESLRRTVARLHEAGILVGMHAFASKISKRDAYVSPVPDRRLLADRTAVLAGDLSAGDAAILTKSDLREWPGSSVARQKVWEGGVEKHQEVAIGDEIVRYESIGPEGRWDTFLGCRRGAWGTRAAAHEAGDECRHLAVDGCIDGYIIDQETDLLDEVAGRLADIFNACDFDMVYFDGCEDVDRRRFDYYAANFQAVAMSKFKKRPLIHKGGGFHHNLWHSFTSSATIDQYPGTYLAYLRAGGQIDQWPTCKDHIDRTAERVAACHDDLIPGELGWFGINPADGEYDGLQYDEVEYLMCKSLARDAPISLQTSFARMEQHPLTADILAMIRRYEALRHHQYGRVPIAGMKRISAEEIERLKQAGKDFIIDTDLWDAPLPVETAAVVLPESREVRIYLGQAGDTTIAAAWHCRGRDGQLTFDGSLLPDTAAIESRLFGGSDRQSMVHKAEGGRFVLPVDHRYRRFVFRGAAAAAVRVALQSATFKVRPPERIWVQAEDYAGRAGAMTKGSAAGIEDAGASGDFIVCAGKIDRSAEAPSYCEYRVRIPKKGVWTVWARVRYPRGGDMSFGIVPAGEEVTLDGNQVLGNCGENGGRWHWTGRGGGVTSVPPGSPIRFALEAGEFVFRIYPREGSGAADSNPRLDVMCFCKEPDDLPRDEQIDQ